MKFDLTGKTEIVTDGASAIGKAIRKAPATNEAEVNIFDLKEEEASEVVFEIQSVGGRAHVHCCDIALQKKS